MRTGCSGFAPGVGEPPPEGFSIKNIWFRKEEKGGKEKEGRERRHKKYFLKGGEGRREQNVTAARSIHVHLVLQNYFL